jgi:hypothetical protein
MLEAAAFLRSNTHAALEQARRLYPGWALFITGHSLGVGHRDLCHFPDNMAASSPRTNVEQLSGVGR